MAYNHNEIFVPPGDVGGPIASKTHVAGNTRRWIVDFTRWLEDGVSLLSSPAPTVTEAVSDITISNVTLLAQNNRVSFLMAGGSVNENFTVSVQVKNTRSEIKNVTIQFSVVSP